MDGWIAFYRKLQESDIWLSEKFTRGQAWVDMIGLANHKDGSFRVRGNRVEVKRGQLAYSEISLANRWKWSRGKVRRFLAEIESEMEQKIVQQKTNLTSLITILNYDKYQFNGTPSGTTDGQQTVQQTDSRRYTNNNDNNVNNDKKIKNLFVDTSDEVRLASYLYNKILENNPKAKKPNIQVWAKQIDLMMRVDKRTPDDIQAVIDWSQDDNFWQINILSTKTLREQFDRLYLKMTHERVKDGAKKDDSGHSNSFVQYLREKADG